MTRTSLTTLADAFSRQKTKREMQNFLEGILTPKEIDELVMRMEIVTRLKRGQSQRQIASELGVGIATVTRGSREIQKGNFAYV